MARHKYTYAFGFVFGLASGVLVTLLVACGDAMGPSMGLDAGPGSPECRRAISNWVTAPGPNANDPNFSKKSNYVLKKCTRTSGNDASEDGEGTETE
jgi:hypothetical protein